MAFQDVNSRATRYAAKWFGTVGVLAFIIQPGIVQGFVDILGLTDREAGLTASAEMTGVAITAILAAALAHRINWQRSLYVCLIIAIIGNAASALVETPALIATTRFIAGIGHGGIISLSFGAIGLTREPDRNFALYLTWLLSYGAAGLLLLPTAFDTIGLSGVFWFFTIVCVLSLRAVKYIPHSADSRAEIEPTALEMPLAMKGVTLIGVLAYNVGIGIAWAYLFLIGIAGGLEEQPIANALTVSQIAGIGGALVAVFLAARLGRMIPLSFGILAGAGSLLLLLGEFDMATYAVAVIVFNMLWNMTLPYILAAAASFDRKGLMTLYAIAMQMIGLGIAPGLAALTLDDSSGYGPMIKGSIYCLLLSFVLIIFVTNQHRRRHLALEVAT
ncbi:MAG: MFS transporter [Gammaproteobacteria bacterium]|nr:MFS transporter [Gammaproteobacteria bacterium]